MKVLGNNILVKPVLKQKSKIITKVDDDKDELTDRCEIIATGEFVSDIQAGQTCVYNYRSGQPLKYKDEDYILIKDHDVYVILD